MDDRGPVVFPVNFVLDRHRVVYRTGEGTKLDAAYRGSRVAFEIDGTDTAARTGWSVLVRGEAIEVTDRGTAQNAPRQTFPVVEEKLGAAVPASGYPPRSACCLASINQCRMM